MSATFRNQVIAGHTIGASKLFGAALMLITLALVMVNSYHMGNFLVSKLTNLSTSMFIIWTLYLAGTGIAALEIPLGKSLVTTYRLHGLTFAVMMQGILAVVIASMAVFAGVNSQLADADRRDTQTASYSVSASSFSNMRQAAAIQRDSSIARASLIHDPASRNIAVLDAKAAYQNQLVNIAQQESTNTLKKPVQMLSSGSDEQYITIMLFSIVCSFGALFCSGFSAIYVSPLVALPAFSLKAKANHDWQSDGSDFRSAKHELSPLMGKAKGFLQREKVPALVRPTDQNDSELTSESERATENRPQPLATGRGGYNCAGVRTRPTSEQKEAEKPEQAEYSKSHYQAIKQGVLNGNIKPTVRPVKNELIRLGVKFIDDKARQQKAGEVLDQLAGEGVIIENPDKGEKGQIVAKYILNPEQEAGEQATAPTEQSRAKVLKLNEPVTCICPDCGEAEVVDTVTRSGKVKSSCGTVYKFSDHLQDKKTGWSVKPVAGVGIGISEEGISPIAGIGAMISK